MGFSDAHKQIAAGWHVDLAAIRKRGWMPRSAAETRRETGCDTPSIEIPYLDLDGRPLGISRWRLADPTKVPPGAKPRKYTGKKSAPVSLYLPPKHDWPSIADDTAETLYIAEGEGKADWPDFPTIGIQGCSAWQAQGKPAEQFDLFKWKRRRVVLLPDSDWRHNPEVARWWALLGKELKKRGAKVKVRLIPELPECFNKENPDKSKTGLDDWFHHTGAKFDQFKALPTLPIDHPFIRRWDGDTAQLPEELRNMRPDAEWWLDATPPSRDMVVDPYGEMTAVAGVIGQGGAGKSHFLTQLAINVATGTPFFSFAVPKPRTVLYLMLERSRASLQRRFHKTAHAWLDSLDDPRQRASADKLLRTNLLLKHATGKLSGIVQAPQGYRAQWQPAPWVAQLIAEIKAAGVEVLIVETIARLNAADESNESFSAMSKELEHVTVETGVCIFFSHHTGQSIREGQYAGRGGSALVDNTSEAIVMRTLTPDERRGLNLGAPQEDDGDLVCVRHERCSDGHAAQDLYLARSIRTGMLRRIQVSQTSDTDLLEELVPAIRKWAAGKAFSSNQFADARKQLGLNIGEKKCRLLFTLAVETGLFIAAGDGRGGHPRMQLNEQELERRAQVHAGITGGTAATAANRGSHSAAAVRARRLK